MTRVICISDCYGKFLWELLKTAFIRKINIKECVFPPLGIVPTREHPI